MKNAQFWQTKSLAQMTAQEWESLCDGCGRCCLAKLEDEDSGELFFTRVACRLLDRQTCRCRNYGRRTQLVADCVTLTADNISEINWLPGTCAYRLLAEGKPLFDWHPLLSGNPRSVHDAGISVQGRVLSEQNVHPDALDEHIVKWVQ